MMERAFLPALLCVATAAASAQGQSTDETASDALRQAIVRVEVDGPDGVHSATGALLGKIGEHGFVATSSYVLIGMKGEPRVVLHPGEADERALEASVAGRAADVDLAVLLVKDADLPEIVPSGDAPDLAPGMDVRLIGYRTGRRGPAETVSGLKVKRLETDRWGTTIGAVLDAEHVLGDVGGVVTDAAGRFLGLGVTDGVEWRTIVPASLLRESLLGRMCDVSAEPIDGAANQSDYRFRVDMIDPLRRVERVALLHADLRKLPAAPEPNENGTWSRLAGSVRVCELQSDGDSFIGDFSQPAAKGEWDLVAQPTLMLAGGVVTYGRPVLLKMQGPGATEKPPRASIDWLGRIDEPASAEDEVDDFIVPGADGPRVGGKSLAKDTYVVDGDLKVTPMDIEAADIVDLAWSSDGRSFFALDKAGLLRRISLADFVIEQEMDLQNSCSFLGRSAAGLVLVLDSTQQVCVVDEASFELKTRFRVPGVQRVACAPSVPVGYMQSGGSLVVADLRTGKIVRVVSVKNIGGDPRRSTKFIPGIGLEFLTLTPDGRYLFSEGGIEMLQRMRVQGAKVAVDEFSVRIGQNAQCIVVSDDARYVAMPSGGGNYPAEHHPAIGYGTYIYAVGDLRAPRIGIKTGAYPRALALDSAAHLIYAQNTDKQLIVLNAGGVVQGEYALTDRNDDTRRFLVHPGGRRLFVLTGQGLYWVEVRKD